MEYYWELRSKNAQNIKALMCPLYYAHRLHLALQDTLEANIVLRNALGVVQSLHHFFHSPKREAILKSFANNDKFGKYIKLKSFCATRWTCR